MWPIVTFLALAAGARGTWVSVAVATFAPTLSACHGDGTDVLASITYPDADAPWYLCRDTAMTVFAHNAGDTVQHVVLTSAHETVAVADVPPLYTIPIFLRTGCGAVPHAQIPVHCAASTNVSLVAGAVAMDVYIPSEHRIRVLMLQSASVATVGAVFLTGLTAYAVSRSRRRQPYVQPTVVYHKVKDRPVTIDDDDDARDRLVADDAEKRS